MRTDSKNRYWNVAVVAASAVFLLLYVVRNDMARWATAEDGLIEWGTAVFYFAAAVMFVLAARRYRFRNVWLLGLALLCLAVAGEEISWGQRLFGVATPDSLSDRNVQQEMNLHNIDGIHQYVRMVGAGIAGVLFFVIPISDALSAPLRRRYERWHVPVFPIAGIGVPLIALSFMVVPRLMFDSTIFAVDEFGEIILSSAFLLYALDARDDANQLTGDGTGPGTARTPTPVGARSRRT